MNFSRLSIAILLVLILGITIVNADSTWVFHGTIHDSEGDVGAFPDYTDIVLAEYGFNETHFSVNVTLRGSIILNETEYMWIGVLIDADMNASTGYRAIDAQVGAEYYLETWLSNNTSLCYLYVYNGSGYDWVWILKTAAYHELHNTKVSMMASREELQFPKGEVSIAIVVTYSPNRGLDNQVVDYTDPKIFPIPESVLVPLSILIVVTALLLKFKELVL